jgi:DUF438 domain-containing protein
MMNASTLSAMLDSLKDPFLFVDNDHVIRFMNHAAVAHYDEGASLLGQSIMDCHNEESQQMMHDIFAEMQSSDLDERLITDDDRRRIYMRAVRDDEGHLLGYYERYEWK